MTRHSQHVSALRPLPGLPHSEFLFVPFRQASSPPVRSMRAGLRTVSSKAMRTRVVVIASQTAGLGFTKSGGNGTLSVRGGVESARNEELRVASATTNV